MIASPWQDSLTKASPQAQGDPLGEAQGVVQEEAEVADSIEEAPEAVVSIEVVLEVDSIEEVPEEAPSIEEDSTEDSDIK